MYKLNLPSFEFKLKKDEGKVCIFDGIRKKYIVLTPEEWVRQHFINYLVSHKKYPRSLIQVEGGLKYNELQRRSDIVVYDRQGSPWMIIECKSPSLPISEAVLEQVSAYNARLKAQYICVTNGMIHLCAHVNWALRKTEQLSDTPTFPEA